MINYEDLKNGDLITFIDDETRTVIVNKIEENSMKICLIHIKNWYIYPMS